MSTACRRCQHDHARHYQRLDGDLGGCTVDGCPCLRYRPPRWWDRWRR